MYKAYTSEHWSSFEIVRVSSASGPIRLGQQTLSVFSGRPRSDRARRRVANLLAGLREQDISSIPTNVFEEYDEKSLMAVLDHKVRSKRTCARALNEIADISNRRFGEKNEEDIDLANRTFQEDLTGCPPTLEQQVLYMLRSGLTPEFPPIATKLRIISNYGASAEDEIRISIMNGRCAYVVVDHHGYLLENEVYYQHSNRPVDSETGSRMSACLVGDLLVTRSPCVQPSDIQRCTAVDIPQLSNLFDVLVCSSMGHRSILSKLSGG